MCSTRFSRTRQGVFEIRADPEVGVKTEMLVPFVERAARLPARKL